MGVSLRSGTAYKILLGILLGGVIVAPSLAQVTPNEILSPDLKALEDTHFQQLIALNRLISGTKFPAFGS